MRVYSNPIGFQAFKTIWKITCNLYKTDNRSGKATFIHWKHFDDFMIEVFSFDFYEHGASINCCHISQCYNTMGLFSFRFILFIFSNNILNTSTMALQGVKQSKNTLANMFNRKYLRNINDHWIIFNGFRVLLSFYILFIFCFNVFQGFIFIQMNLDEIKLHCTTEME